MSDSENELFGADLGDSASISSAVRRSSRILSRQDDSSASISDMPKAHLSTPAPSLEFSQPLALAGVIGNSPIQDVLPASPGTSAPGKKRAKKINTAPPAKRKSVSASFAPPDHPDVPLHSSNSILQSLLSSMQAIDARLQSLEKIQASATPTASGNPLSLPSAKAPAHAPQPCIYSASTVLNHSLDSAIPSPMLGRPYVPIGANISSRARSKILQGKDVNLISLILPSPECENKVSNSELVTAVIKSADPRLLRDMLIGEFVVAFGIYRDVICSVYPERRQELDTYLSLIGDLNLR